MTKKKESKIKASMTFGELLHKYPESAETLMAKGMHCIGCPASNMETIKQGAQMHGIDAKKLVEELNKKLELS
jgi:hybrid cluster-associated redox disulfide protein